MFFSDDEQGPAIGRHSPTFSAPNPIATSFDTHACICCRRAGAARMDLDQRDARRQDNKHTHRDRQTDTLLFKVHTAIVSGTSSHTIEAELTSASIPLLTELQLLPCSSPSSRRDSHILCHIHPHQFTPPGTGIIRLILVSVFTACFNLETWGGLQQQVGLGVRARGHGLCSTTAPHIHHRPKVFAKTVEFRSYVHAQVHSALSLSALGLFFDAPSHTRQRHQEEQHQWHRRQQ